MADKTVARRFGEWAAKHAVKAIYVFGVDVVYAVTTGGNQISAPVLFNDFIWSMAALEVVSFAFKAFRAARKRARNGQPGLDIHFIAGVKPGDLGFETPADWAEEIPFPSEGENDEGPPKQRP